MTPLSKPIARVTHAPLETHGPNRDRPFVVTLAPGDLLTLRPLRRRQGEVSIRLADVYRYALMCRANSARLEKARERKATLAQRRRTRALARAVASELRRMNASTQQEGDAS